jgi:anti-anti-sigma factor
VRNDLLSVAVDAGDETTRLTIAGELDLKSASELAAQLQVACAQRPANLELDISGLTYCDSTGIHLIERGLETCRANGTCMRITGAQPMVRRLFEVTGLGGLLEPYVSLPEANDE